MGSAPDDGGRYQFVGEGKGRRWNPLQAVRREDVIHPSYACDDGNKMKTKQRASGKIEIKRIVPYRTAATNSLFALRVNTYYQEVNCEEVTMRLTQQFNVVMICAAFAFIGSMLFI